VQRRPGDAHQARLFEAVSERHLRPSSLTVSRRRVYGLVDAGCPELKDKDNSCRAIRYDVRIHDVSEATRRACAPAAEFAGDGRIACRVRHRHLVEEERSNRL
jgi:hypothetical protein